ncbi:MAG: adenine phosphoribosyltransferase [Pseudomonadota bacterium]
MNRTAFRARFATTGPVVLPVIHVLDARQTLENIGLALGEGAPGVFLINHDFGIDAFLPIIAKARAAHPRAWIGINFLAVTGRDAFPVLGRLAREGVPIDAYWADDARIDERAADQTEATEIAAARERSGWHGVYFGGTAFKKQRPVAAADWQHSALLARDWMDVVTTSGVATGEAAEGAKIAAFRQGLGDRPLAIASGITPENAGAYRAADCFMVATGINREGDFYNIDPARLRALLAIAAGLHEEA